MSNQDPLVEVYVYENSQLLEKLESLLLTGEQNESFDPEQVDEIFRILHTIKGASAMMSFDGVAKLAHIVEDLFAYLRQHSIPPAEFKNICNFVFASADFIKFETAKVQNCIEPDGDASELIHQIDQYVQSLKSAGEAPPEAEAPVQSIELQEMKTAAAPMVSDETTRLFRAQVFFERDCKMENIRAFGIVNSIEGLCAKIITIPADVLKEHSEDEIITNGFTLFMETSMPGDELKAKINQAFFITKLDFQQLALDDDSLPEAFHPIKDITVKEQDIPAEAASGAAAETAISTAAASAAAVNANGNAKQNYMSVNVNKLDKLMDLVGEIVITESMVTKHPALLAMHLDSFEKSARQLRKLTDELQDIVMSIRMIPISTTFHKMERIVRDMSMKMNKKARMEILGEDTEVDKNIIDNLSDPLMHIIRNCMDHGLETEDERIAKGKDPVGKITMEARNTGSDVLILVSDDGRGLNRDILIKKATERGLVNKPESEITDKEAYAFIFAAGFSTKEQVTEFSGRGVGMDVVSKNIMKLGGSLSIDSTPGHGMTVQIRIPLTLAIMDGMQVMVGNSSYIIPLLSIQESFKPQKKQFFTDPDGHEMILIRGKCYPIMRLYKEFNIHTDVTQMEDGILVMVESDTQTTCVFVDKLIGEQQTVVKALPIYVTRMVGRMKRIAGCTILGDGNISLILDVNNLLN